MSTKAAQESVKSNTPGQLLPPPPSMVHHDRKPVKQRLLILDTRYRSNVSRGLHVDRKIPGMKRGSLLHPSAPTDVLSNLIQHTCRRRAT